VPSDTSPGLLMAQNEEMWRLVRERLLAGFA
jgi:hypothetical protein